MAKLVVLFASIALLLVAVTAAADVTQDSRRLKGGRGWRGKPRQDVLNLDVHQLSEQTNKNGVIRTRGQLKAGKEGLRQHPTLEPRLLSHSATEYESQLTTNVISFTVEKYDEEKILASIEPPSPVYVSTGSVPVLAYDVDEEHFETTIIQSGFASSQPMVKDDINQRQKNGNPITEKSRTSKIEVTKSDKIAPVTIPIEPSNDDIGVNNPLVGNSGEDSDEDSAVREIESSDGKSQSRGNSLQPSLERTNSEGQSQRQNRASQIVKSVRRNQENTQTNSHSRPLPVVAVNFKPTLKPRQSASKQTPAPSLPQGNRRKLPPLGLHPKSPWIRKSSAQGSSTPVPANSHVQETSTSVPVHGPKVQQSKERVHVSATPVPVHGHRVKQSKNRVHESAISVPVHSDSAQQRTNVVQARATSVPVHGSNVHPRKNGVHVSETSISENVQQVLTLQTEVPPEVKAADSDENVDSRRVVEKRIVPQKSPLQIVSANKQTENKKRVTKQNEVPKDTHSISETLNVVSSSSKGRLAKVQKAAEKSAPEERASRKVSPEKRTESSNVKASRKVSPEKRTESSNVKASRKVSPEKRTESSNVKASRKVSPEKRTESSNVDVKPQTSSSAQLISRHSGASNVVAIASIGLISFVTFMTIMGVYFKKISFSRKRYGQHIPLSTEEDDFPLFNRQTNYDNYESPYKSWQDL